MKKIFTLFALLMMVVMGANAQNAKNAKFLAQAVFADANGNNQQFAAFFICDDYKMYAVLPPKDAKVYANQVGVGAVLAGITGFGMKKDEVRSYTKTTTTNRTEAIIPGEYLPNFYSYVESDKAKASDAKHFTVKVNGDYTIKYTVTTSVGDGTDVSAGYVVVVATPDDVATAQAAWTEICKSLDVTVLPADKSEFCAKVGSYVANNGELAGVIKESLFSGKDLKTYYETFTKNVKVNTEDYKDINYMAAGLAPESYLTIGQTKIALKKDCSAEVKIDNTEHNTYIPGTFLSDVMTDAENNLKIASDSELKKQFIKDVLGYAKKFDAAVAGKNNVTIDITIGAKTAISNVAAETTSNNNGAIYNINGTRVSNMNQHGVYVVNGKKVLK